MPWPTMANAIYDTTDPQRALSVIEHHKHRQGQTRLSNKVFAVATESLSNKYT